MVKEKRKKIYVFLTIHRSGSSLIAKSMETLGLNLGDHLLPGNEHNKLGYYEDIDISNINNDILDFYESSWHDPVLLDEVKLKMMKKILARP